jgi:hypothetical protein
MLYFSFAVLSVSNNCQPCFFDEPSLRYINLIRRCLMHTPPSGFYFQCFLIVQVFIIPRVASIWVLMESFVGILVH